MSGTPSNVRRFNERALLRRLRQPCLTGSGNGAELDRGVPRSELARATGLSVPTVGKVVASMAASGWIEEVIGDEALEAGPGRPARLVRLGRTVRRLLVIQLGVRHTRLAMLPVAGPGVDEWSVTFRTPTTAQRWGSQLREVVGRMTMDEPWCVALSLPGVVDEATARVLLSPNLHWSEQADFKAIMRGLWPVPLCAVQEIRALALGHLAADPGQRDFLLVDFGAGVGAAAVIEGYLYESSLPMSGEIGHCPVAGNTRPCGCGGRGCLETLLSRRGLRQTYARHHNQSRVSWKMVCQGHGSRGAEPWLAKSLDAAAAAIAGALNMLGLRHVVVTGSLAEMPPAVLDQLADGVRQKTMWGRFGEVTMEAAPRRRAAGLVAAAVDRVLLPDPIGGHEHDMEALNLANAKEGRYISA